MTVLCTGCDFGHTPSGTTASALWGERTVPAVVTPTERVAELGPEKQSPNLLETLGGITANFRKIICNSFGCKTTMIFGCCWHPE